LSCTSTECADGDVRKSELELLEICVNDTWVRICTDFFRDENQLWLASNWVTLLEKV